MPIFLQVKVVTVDPEGLVLDQMLVMVVLGELVGKVVMGTWVRMGALEVLGVQAENV